MVAAGRREVGFSQEELADVMDKSEADIALWEAGLEVPANPSTVMELAAALKLEPDVLLAAADEAEAPDTLEEPDDVEEPEAVEPEIEDPVDDEPSPDLASLGEDVVTRPARSPVSTAAPSTAGTAATAPSPTQVAAARMQMPAPAPSYIEDDKLVRLYRIRLIATAVVGLVLLWLFFWAFGNFWDAVSVLWDSLRPGA